MLLYARANGLLAYLSLGSAPPSIRDVAKSAFCGKSFFTQIFNMGWRINGLKCSFFDELVHFALQNTFRAPSQSLLL